MKQDLDFDLEIIGAREHNLKNVTCRIPRNKITVITGLSGSGKSSFAFDTLYAEGQRRYVDSLSTYARNFLEKLKKPEIDRVSGLSPTIAIDQKSVGLNPRSTVGTVTEIYDYLRLLYARAGTAKCPTHQIPVEAQNPNQIVDSLMARPEKSRWLILSPVAQGKKGEFQKEVAQFIKKGFSQAYIDGELVELHQFKKLVKTKAHDIDLIIDKIVIKPDARTRIAESVNLAVQLSGGLVAISDPDRKHRDTYSIHAACSVCGFSFPELEPRFFSFNNPRGACKTCNGLGTIDIEEAESVEYGGPESHNGIKKVSYRVSEKVRQVSVQDQDKTETEIDFLSIKPCPDCKGSRLKTEALNVFIGEKNIAELSALASEDLLSHFRSENWSKKNKLIAEKILKQIEDRLDYLVRVGAGYLSLDRPTRTLSGGENQRIRLAAQVGSSLVGVTYILDEPSIGLHPRDHDRLLSILRKIRDLGNTVIMVEHDEETILTADHVIDFGPGAGDRGGAIIAQGTPEDIQSHPESLTGKYLARQISVDVPKVRRKGNGLFLEVLGATGNNLQNVDLRIPCGTLTCVTGVSGSGKSTLIMDTLYRAAANHFYDSGWVVSPARQLKGLEHFDKVIELNQNPIGRTPRSNPATYTGLFPLIRDLFSQLPDAKVRGFGPGRFSFNVKGGRCETCQGAGQVKVEMHFLSDVYVECETCKGLRYNRETLEVRYKEKNIAEILGMRVSEALPFFTNHPQIRRKLETLSQVGLDYLTLGQSSTTVSGGEAQRIKLSKELSKRATGRTLYILDEPTTGLHFEDIRKLVELLQSLTEAGNTVIVIEHNMDVVKASDHVVDLGPLGGTRGGKILFSGPPEGLVQNPESATAPYLKKALSDARSF